MIALISDIHGNLEALRAVLADIAERKPQAVFCLGDVVGYGPDPVPCVDLVRESCSAQLMGNHDYALLSAPMDFNPSAAEAIYYHQELLRPAKDNPERAERWNYLLDLKLSIEGEKGDVFVHASPRDPMNEYILPFDVTFDIPKVVDIFQRLKRHCFVGHTHFPGVMTPRPEFLTLDELAMEYQFGAEKAVVNIGSVGQPRDGDPRACYLELYEDGVRYRRIEYDFEETMRKIFAADRLDRRLGERLRYGR